VDVQQQRQKERHYEWSITGNTVGEGATSALELWGGLYFCPGGKRGEKGRERGGGGRNFSYAFSRLFFYSGAEEGGGSFFSTSLSRGGFLEEKGGALAIDLFS